MYLVTGVRDSSSRYVGYCFPVFSLFSLLIMSVLALGLHMQQVNALSPTKSPFGPGYKHGCNDSRISNFSERYINQPGKGPSFHTDEFMRGYDTGFNVCTS